MSVNVRRTRLDPNPLRRETNNKNTQNKPTGTRMVVGQVQRHIAGESCRTATEAISESQTGTEISILCTVRSHLRVTYWQRHGGYLLRRRTSHRELMESHAGHHRCSGGAAQYLDDLQSRSVQRATGRIVLNERTSRSQMAANDFGNPDNARSNRADCGVLILESIFEADFRIHRMDFVLSLVPRMPSRRFKGICKPVFARYDADLKGYFDTIRMTC